MNPDIVAPGTPARSAASGVFEFARIPYKLDGMGPIPASSGITGRPRGVSESSDSSKVSLVTPASGLFRRHIKLAESEFPADNASVPNPLILFGDRVRELRLKAGLSQEALAKRAGIHRNYLGEAERGERNVGLLNVHRIARALRVHPSELFTKF